MDYKDKYIKCKTKYKKLCFQFKNTNISDMVGGDPDLIIHISGPSGAGKTTLVDDSPPLKRGDSCRIVIVLFRQY